MPLGATEAVTGGRKKETEEILFMGTYDDPDSIYEMVSLSPEPLKTYMKELIDMRVEDPVLPMEEAFRQLLKTHGEDLPDDKFSLFMNAMYSVDAYIRDYFRKAAVDELVRAKIPVRLVGEGWEKYESCNEAYVTREKAVVFGLSFEKIAHADVLLNVSPFFNHGAHDRIFAGMANHCTVLTDQNPYLERILKEGEQVCMYSLKDIRTLSDYAAELLSNRALCREIQNNAYTEFKHKYTWEEKAKQLLACTLK
jgi:spore maturation protein CgeB